MKYQIESQGLQFAVIDTVVQRGGFKGEELTTIGTLRDQATQIIQICETFQSEQSKVDNKVKPDILPFNFCQKCMHCKVDQN